MTIWHLNAIAAMGLAVALILGLRGHDHSQAAPAFQQQYRELACQEDEQILIDLDSRNLPIAICMQRIER